MPQALPLVDLLAGAVMVLCRNGLGSLVDLSLELLRGGRAGIWRSCLRPGYYQRWLRRRERPQRRLLCQTACGWPYRPTIAMFILLGPGDLAFLPFCLESLSQQCYPHWEAHIVDLAGTASGWQEMPALRPWRQDRRVRLVGSGQGGGSPQASLDNILAGLSADYLMLPDGRDQLSPQACAALVGHLNHHADAEVVYGDEDDLDEAGQRSNPFWKPDWSPDLALALPYTGGGTLFRTAAVQTVGGIRSEFWPAHGYDLLLRLLPHTPPHRLQHVPQILYHRRLDRTEAQAVREERTQAAGMLALQEYLAQTGQPGQVRPGLLPGTWRVARKISQPPGISIIIPFRDKARLLSQCLTSIFQKTVYPHFEVILINNDSQEPATYASLARWAGHPQVRLYSYSQPFNFAAMNNLAASRASYPCLLFLNNDTEVISPDWLAEMAAYLERADVGAVGVKLLYPDHTIQHGGLTIGGGGCLCGDLLRGLPDRAAVAHGLAQVPRNVSAVTGACLLTKKALFDAMGGFDAGSFPVCYNDVDFCLKLQSQGYVIVWTPAARLYHHESASRGRRPAAADLARLYAEQRVFEAKWWPVIVHDPYYHANLSRLFDGYVYY